MSQTEANEFDRLFYPYLFEGGKSSLDDVLTQVQNSTLDKCRELVALRRRVLETLQDQILAAGQALAGAFAAGGTLLAFGNGGSSTDALDIVLKLHEPPWPGARPLPALALAHNVAMLTAVGNDVGYDNVFARQVIAFGRAGDIAFGISSSGNSANILRAFEQAHTQGLLTIGLAGYDGGKMARMAVVDFKLVVPGDQVPRIQEVQGTIYNALLAVVFTSLYGNGEVQHTS
jgi:D-sedoheptulose 7-phosphate isomerase